MKHVDLIKMLISSLRFVPEVVSVPVYHEKFHGSKPKMCFNNAFLYLMEHTDCSYILGYVVLDIGVPIEHAWVKSNKGYLDVTLDVRGGEEYYPLVELSYSEVCDFVFKKEYPPSIYDYNRFIFKE